jgi:hypothetical protein
MRHGVGCADNQHCCPHDTPVCDTQQGVCTSEDGSKSVPWTSKVPASYSETPKPLPDAEVDAEDLYYGDDGNGEEAPTHFADEFFGAGEDAAPQEQEQEQEHIAVV